MENKKDLGILASSADSSKIGMTVQGFIIGLSVLIIWFAQYIGLEVTSEQVTTMAIQIGGAIATIIAVCGIVRKIIISVQQKFSK